MNDFGTELRVAILAKPKLSKRDAKILALLDGGPSKKREKRLARMENHARAVIGASPTSGAIDWSQIDWGKFLESILSVLMAVLKSLLL